MMSSMLVLPFAPSLEFISTTPPKTLEGWSKWICSYTPRELREAMCRTNKVLYRGDDLSSIDERMLTTSSRRRRIDHPAPDLLQEETYNDPKALNYFQCLESALPSFARPSTGHVATTAPETAAAWGPVVSIFPLGDQWSYVFPKDRELLFPGGICGDTNELVIDKNVVDALQMDREVLFASKFSPSEQKRWKVPPEIASWQSAYIVIPREEDEALLRLLQSQNFGLN